MKTTLEIPDPLFRKAKTTAALEGRSMKAYVVEALAEKLERKGKGWRSMLGRLSPAGRKAAGEISNVIEAADFSKIDVEAWR